MPSLPRKTCKDCGVEKSRTQFYCHPTYADGRMNTCKVCKRKYAREWYEAKREIIRVRKRVWAARPEQRAKRAAYARSERGRQVHRTSCRIYNAFKRAAQVAA